MASLRKSIRKLMQVDGIVGVAVVDGRDGLTLATAGGGPDFDMEVAGAGHVDVVRAQQRTADRLALDDQIEDLVIVLGRQYHLVRPLRRDRQLFLYLVLDRQRGNLGMTRFMLMKAAKRLAL